MIQFIAVFIPLNISILLQNKLSLDSVIVAASVGFIAAFFTQRSDIKNLIYVATFCSMGVSIHNNFQWVHSFFISLIVVRIYNLIEVLFIGHGGKLGSVAFVSSIIYFAVGFYVFN